MTVPTTPLIVVALLALGGAGLLGYLFTRLQRPVWIGALIGAVASGAGSLLFMVPLNFCTFEPEREALEVGFGIFLMLLTAGGAMALAVWLVQQFWGQKLVSDAQQSAGGMYKGRLLPILLLAPTIIILALFLYYPALDTFGLSVQLVRLGARRSAFVCVDNFVNLVGDPTYINTVVLTLVMSALIVVIGLSLSLLIATMAYQPIKGASIYRTLLIWPYAISPAVAGVIFLLLFNPAGGIINYFLNGIFGIQVPWLNNPQAAPWAVVIASVWKSLGFNILFYIAGLQNVPKDLQESAAIDGANALERFFNIVVPLLSPITFFLIVTNMTYAFFDTFGTIDYLTSGGPVNSTTTMMYRIYEVGIQGNDLGKAAAQSLVLFALVIGLTVLQFRTTGEQVNYGA